MYFGAAKCCTEYVSGYVNGTSYIIAAFHLRRNGDKLYEITDGRFRSTLKELNTIRNKTLKIKKKSCSQ
jgi:hypothetical protein